MSGRKQQAVAATHPPTHPPTLPPCPPARRFLFDIVANKRNSIDVDNDGDVTDGRVSLNQNHDLDLLSPISLQNNHHNQNNFNTNLAVNHYGEFTIVLR